MNRFHGIQQDRECSLIPSFTDDTASTSCYEADADDDSFQTAGFLRHKKKLPDFGQDAITKSRAKRLSLRGKLASYDLERDSEIEEVNSTRKEDASSTGTLITVKERHSFQNATKNDTVLHETLVSAELVALANSVCMATSKPNANAKGSTGATVESASPKSIMSNKSSSFTILNIDLPPKVNRKVKRIMPRSESLPFMPKSASSLLCDELSSSSELFRIRKEANNQSPECFLPPFVRYTIPSPASSHSSSSGSVSTAIPRDHTDCNSIATISKSKRVGEIKSRLRNIESQYRRSSTRSISSAFLGSTSERDMKSSTSCCSMQNARVYHRIVREVLFVFFGTFLIYVGYLSRRDTQSNATQLQLSLIQFTERSIELANNTRLKSINIQLLKKTLELKQLKSESSRLDNEETSQLLNKVQSSSLPLAMADLFIPAAAPTPMPSNLIHLEAPIRSDEVQEVLETIERPVDSFRKRNVNIMDGFFYVQSMLD